MRNIKQPIEMPVFSLSDNQRLELAKISKLKIESPKLNELINIMLEAAKQQYLASISQQNSTDYLDKLDTLKSDLKRLNKTLTRMGYLDVKHIEQMYALESYSPEHESNESAADHGYFDKLRNREVAGLKVFTQRLDFTINQHIKEFPSRAKGKNKFTPSYTHSISLLHPACLKLFPKLPVKFRKNGMMHKLLAFFLKELAGWKGRTEHSESDPIKTIKRALAEIERKGT